MTCGARFLYKTLFYHSHELDYREIKWCQGGGKLLRLYGLFDFIKNRSINIGRRSYLLTTYEGVLYDNETVRSGHCLCSMRDLRQEVTNGTEYWRKQPNFTVKLMRLHRHADQHFSPEHGEYGQHHHHHRQQLQLDRDHERVVVSVRSC